MKSLRNDQKAHFVFAKFKAVYGNKWTTGISETQFKFMEVDWGNELKPYPENQIMWALSRLRKYYDEWPPNQFEFLRLCAGIDEEAIDELASKSYVTYHGWEDGPVMARKHLEAQSEINPVELFKYLQGTPDEREELDQTLCHERERLDQNVKNLPLVRKHTPPKLTVL